MKIEAPESAAQNYMAMLEKEITLYHKDTNLQ